MFLKRLEIFGFKSFPEKTVFTFDDGMTAIVGPNGCGKSNVSDAIKWVIGEQKAKSLRGNHMLDVIFNGSETQKALGMAEVSLVLDNSQNTFPLEFSEIKITRKLYRSGESDYMINKKNCRLKDITELLMDTGLGSESYSVIEQGRMDRVLTSKPEDRRMVFEEAAGITKYKARRKEALRKLERTSDNLLRVNDILVEVTRQMNSIERQARKAQRYKELFEELRRLDVDLQRAKVLQLEHDLQSNLEALQQLESQDTQSHKAIATIEAKVVGLREEINALEITLNEHQNSLNKANAQYNVLENQISHSRNKMAEIDGLKSQKQKEIEDNQAHLEQYRQQQEAEVANREQLAGDKDKLRQLMEDDDRLCQEALQDLNLKQTQLEDQKKEILHLVTEQSRNKDQIAHREHLLQSHAHKKDDLLQQKERKERRKEELLQLSQEAKHRSLQSENYLKELEGQLSELQGKEQDCHQRIEQQTESLSQKRSLISAQKSELDVLEAMHKNYEGYSQGTKEVLKKRDLGEGVFAKVQSDMASVMSVKDNRYDVAIEAVLGQLAQSIVVSSVDDMKEMMHHLRSNKVGRAAFMALDLCRSTAIQSEASAVSMNGCLGRASDLVAYDETYRDVVEHAMGDIFIFSDLDQALEAYRSQQSAFSALFVSLDGTVIDRSGAVIGGASSGQSSHVIGREKKIAELKSTLHQLEADWVILDGQLKASKEELQSVKNEVSNKRKAIEQQNQRLHQDQQELARYELECQHLTDQVGSVHGELGQIALAEEKVSSEMKEFRLKNEELEQSIIALKDKQTGYATLVQQSEEIYQKRQNTLTEHKVAWATIDEKAVSLERHIAQLIKMAEDEQRRLQQNHQLLSGYDQQKEALAASILSHQDEVVAAREERDRWQQSIQDLQDKRRLIYADLQSCEQEMHGHRKILMELQQGIKTQEVRKHQVELSIQNIKEKLYETYQLDWDAVGQFDVGAFEEEIDKNERLLFLKDKVQKIGPVNTEAIAEFDALQERHGFLSQQITDLNEAKESLLKVIAQVNKESRKRFKEAFVQINENFKELFKVLFGGGKAELLLLDENDVLESGIEVIASPPGKKMQSISLMSGGERAMTGIALLFAMFKVNPSPFCVLDEIDAPLDEGNVDRFIDIMDSFKAKTQFIVITHNKKTMAKADVIYGVTMQKPGISKSIAIKMIDYASNQPQVVAS